MELRESPYQEGAGSLIFEVQVEYEAKPGMQRSGQNTVTEKRTEHGFMDIADVVAIEKLIRNTILRTKPGKADEDLEDGADAAGQVVRVAAKEVKAPASVQNANIKPAPVAAGSWPDADEAEEAPGAGKKKKKIRPQTVEASRGLIEDSPVSERVKERALNRLDDDEVVLWVGQPVEKLILIRSLGPAIFSLVIAVILAVISRKTEWTTWVFAGALLVAAV